MPSRSVIDQALESGEGTTDAILRVTYLLGNRGDSLESTRGSSGTTWTSLWVGLVTSKNRAERRLSSPMQRPLLLLDIDGVISLFGFDPARPPVGRFVLVDGIAHYLSAGVGEHLRRLGGAFELAWCSGWEEKAEEYLPDALELPAGTRYLTFEPEAQPAGRHWKLASIDRYASSERALAWVDDAHDESCLEWAVARPGPTLLVATDPAVGLTGGHVAESMGWAARLGAAEGAR
jgi:hypothetical protein